MSRKLLVMVGAGLLLATSVHAPAALAQVKPPSTPDEPGGRWGEAKKKAVDIGSQPARDVGMSKREIPPILEKAFNDPYSLKGLKTCRALASEVTNLNAVLGADYSVGNEYTENRAGKLAEAGGKTIINSIIPFRGLVREVTGAAPADRHMNAVVDAGLARRGFLRGVHLKQGCKTKF
ncbi:hypothetical protein [Caulobacter sp. RL271]|uniref:Uncharacterized protein n=1 Tax=Caulobacter segnis TaxID=88688 RepID=A0ABY4ZYK0_9CAUL|nr:hypothetical protein [Caulobacter segnis]USQ97062.1 hypothetical protein MZV50_05775 [Caulobacter segnis]